MRSNNHTIVFFYQSNKSLTLCKYVYNYLHTNIKNTVYFMLQSRVAYHTFTIKKNLLQQFHLNGGDHKYKISYTSNEG